MSKRREYEIPAEIFPCQAQDEWRIREIGYDEKNHHLNETIFALANGFFGMRGSFEEPYEGSRDSEDGTFINGFYEKHSIKYAESAFAFADTDNVMLNITNPKPVYIYLVSKKSGLRERFSLFKGIVDRYVRNLAIDTAEVTRDVLWTSPCGWSIRVLFRRIVSVADLHCALIQCTVTPLNFSSEEVTIEFTSGMICHVRNKSASDDPRIGSGLPANSLQVVHIQPGKGVLSATAESGLAVSCAQAVAVHVNGKSVPSSPSDELSVAEAFIVADGFKANDSLVLDKFISVFASRDLGERGTIAMLAAASPGGVAGGDGGGPDVWKGDCGRDLLALALNSATAAAAGGAETFTQRHRAKLATFWKASDVTIEGDPRMQQGIRFNILHLLMCAGSDGLSAAGAKGLTGEGYSGHYFWDTEIYLMPFFMHTNPHITRQLLLHRVHMLPAARLRASQMSIAKGAMFPWRTIAGDECSAYFPAGTAQVHISADIVYALQNYVQATGDEQFLVEHGAELVFEVARAFICLGVWKNDFFEIHNVTGPDEYTACVNNNYYTNYMAQNAIGYAFETACQLKIEHPTEWAALCDALGISQSEVSEWKKARDHTYLPYDSVLGIHPQDDSFSKLAEWDWANTPPTKYPLLLHFHPLVIYRHKVCKQADLLLAQYLLPDRFTPEQLLADYEYYEPRTTHDSSLSPCVFSIMASAVGKRAKAYRYFQSTARLDLENIHNNAQHGVHIACMAGAWHCVVSGFAGMRTGGGTLRFEPYVPDGWDGYSCKVKWRGSTVKLSVDRRNVTYELVEGKSVRFIHNRQQRVTLNRRGPIQRLCLRARFEEINSLPFDAVIFDLGAIVVDVDVLHFKAWKAAFDSFFQDPISSRDPRVSSCSVSSSIVLPASPDVTSPQPRSLTMEDFDTYLRHQYTHYEKSVGHYSNVAAFLASCGITLPRGSTDDGPTDHTLCGLANRKAQMFRHIVKQEGVTLRPGAFEAIKDLHESGVSLGLVSFSKSAACILEESGIALYFDKRLDGVTGERLGLKGKPEADYYFHVVEMLNAEPSRTVAFLCDITGYSSGSLAPFGLICVFSSGAVCQRDPKTAAITCTGDAPSDEARGQVEAGGHQTFTTFEGLSTDLIETWMLQFNEQSSRSGDCN